jgi:hypothetical protein
MGTNTAVVAGGKGVKTTGKNTLAPLSRGKAELELMSTMGIKCRAAGALMGKQRKTNWRTIDDKGIETQEAQKDLLKCIGVKRRQDTVRDGMT